MRITREVKITVKVQGDTRETDGFELRSTKSAVVGGGRGGDSCALHKTPFHIFSHYGAVG